MNTLSRICIAASLFLAPTAALAAEPEKLVVAGGCFWCVESDFERVEGVAEVVSGYSGGSKETASYKMISKGGTGHLEVVEITYDPDVISVEMLLHKFLRSIDVVDDGGQFCDRGESYRTAIFVKSPQERAAAEAAIAEGEAELGQKIVTPILDLTAFYEAEKYHQDFYKNSPVRYKLYRKGCGRDRRVRELWGDNAAFAHTS